jgi:hypothetical protein
LGAFASLLPGLYFLALAAALIAALWRWFDPVPVRPLVAYAAVLAALFGPVLFGGRVLLPLTILRSVAPFQGLPADSAPSHHLAGDLVRQIAPWGHTVRQAWLEGRWPLWNPYVGAGMPLLGDPQSQALQPLVLASYPLEVWAGVGVTAALRVLVALVFFFLLLRRQRLGEGAALVGSLAYGCGSFLLLWLGWPIANPAAWLPAVLYALARLSPAPDTAAAAGESRAPLRRRDLALLSLSIGGLLLSGHPETILYAVALAGLFGLSRAFALPRRTAVRFLLAATAAGGAAGLAAAPVLLPAVAYLPTTARSAQVAYELTPRPLAELWNELRQPATLAFWRERATERLLPVAAPRAWGDPDRFWGRDNLIEQTSGFVGSAALVAALAALLTLLSGGPRRPQERLIAWTLLACLALVAQPPGFDRLIGGLPVLGPTGLHKHHRILLLISACLAYLAACQVDRTARGEGKRWPLAVAAAVLLALFPWAYLRQTAPADPPVPAFSPGFWLGLQAALVAAALALLLAPRLRRIAPWGLAVLLVGELVFLNRAANLACSRHLAYPETATSRFLAAHLGPARMVGMGAAFLPNFPSAFGLRDVRIDNPSQPRAYAHATRSISEPGQLVPVFSRPHHPLYDLLAVRYVVAPVGLPLPLPRVLATAEAWVYERPRPLPPFFLPATARIYRDGDWGRFLERNRSFARRSLVAASPGATDDWAAADAAPSALTLLRFRPSRFTLDAHLAERRLVASSLYQDGHWRALADGRPLTVLWSNGPFASVWLPAGEHRLEWIYRPAPFLLGCLLAALGLAAGAALWVPPPGAILGSGRPPDPVRTSR